MQMSSYRRTQRGVSLSGLLVWGVIIGVVAMLSAKVVPVVIDYFKIVQAIKAVSRDPATKGEGVADIRRSINTRFSIDNVDSVQAEDIDVTKDGNDVVLSFAYSKRIPLVANVSLLIDFDGTTAPGR
jgi:spore cortex formation protein SpoVR/YcgB (stage V sporulation)